jgi:ABC-2 type transport system ATP-binding protein
MTTAAGSALSVATVSKRYGRSNWALRDVSLSIASGEIVALVGPNGAGKSSLLKLWAGFERPTSGQAFVSGRDAWARRRETLRQVAYVGQGSPLAGRLSPKAHIDIAASLRDGFDRVGALARLAKLQIPLDRPARQLSGGQRSQVALTVALASTSQILLLDEPLADLDPLARRMFMAEAFTACRTSARTLVLSSHVVADIDPTDNRILLLDRGRLVLDGRLGELMERHFLTDAPRPGDRLVGLVLSRSGVSTQLVETDRPPEPGEAFSSATAEDIVLAYLARATL